LLFQNDELAKEKNREEAEGKTRAGKKNIRRRKTHRANKKEKSGVFFGEEDHKSKKGGKNRLRKKSAARTEKSRDI